ncbi:LacI family DNA-binding transcriptional regulator [Paracoccus sp. Z330]|uniref:LacI family DNA-binding transcriptional regulator n=1 Tax=Paracoccus onchidii TaxID=3017813 RepID=A0ABT4ZAP7_9RHOB|nr:LacI family DNA-binding transcriptional regulator [Paracoccus onchidii]MDB6176359.1 LacI family DNA-binding transcriptional regulator [Paracoccus onchidii]
MSKRVTIKSIAKDLGISHMTVSRALSDHPNVHAETREAIQTRARELGYVKSAAARAMRGEETQIVGLLLPNIVNEFYARFANTLAKACGENGLHLIIHLTDDDPQAEASAIARLHEVQAMAAVMVPAPSPKAPPARPSIAMRQVQLIRQREDGEPAPAILVDDQAAIVQAVQHLARKGHERIGYIGAHDHLSSGRNRLAAFRQGICTADLDEYPDLICTGAPNFTTGREQGRRILRPSGATAVICGGFEISNGALNAFMDLAPAARSETAFVGYGDPSFYTWLNGGLSTIAVPVDRLAHQTLAILKDKDHDAAACHRFAARFVDRGPAVQP